MIYRLLFLCLRRNKVYEDIIDDLTIKSKIEDVQNMGVDDDGFYLLLDDGSKEYLFDVVESLTRVEFMRMCQRVLDKLKEKTND